MTHRFLQRGRSKGKWVVPFCSSKDGENNQVSPGGVRLVFA
jgi:hypothetical protein